MSLHLEPIYLANVLLNLKGADSIKAFPFVSKNCREATITLKVNPAGFYQKPSAILRFFPNINTMVVHWLTSFKETDTVTALVVGRLDFEYLTKEHLKLADRVVEIRDCCSNKEHPADFTLFPRLERLTLTASPTTSHCPSTSSNASQSPAGETGTTTASSPSSIPTVQSRSSSSSTPARRF